MVLATLAGGRVEHQLKVHIQRQVERLPSASFWGWVGKGERAQNTRRRGEILIAFYFRHGWPVVMKSIAKPHFKYVMPTAPSRSVTIHGGESCPAWCDVKLLRSTKKTLDVAEPDDEPSVREATALVHSLLHHEHTSTGVPYDRIVLGGFSQGGATALFSALHFPHRLAGCVVLGTYLQLIKQAPLVVEPANRDLPVLQCHGDVDPVVNPGWGRLTADALSAALPNYKFKEYAGVLHEISDDELNDVDLFIDQCLP